MSEDFQKQVDELRKQDERDRLATGLDILLTSLQTVDRSITDLSYLGVDITNLANLSILMKQSINQIAQENELT